MPVRGCPTCSRPFPPRGPCPHCRKIAIAVEEPESPAANPVVVSVTIKEIPAAITPQQSVAQAELTVRNLLEAVDAVKGVGDRAIKKVKQAVRNAFPVPSPSPEIPVTREIPVRRGRGRPRKYASDAQKQQAYRQRRDLKKADEERRNVVAKLMRTYKRMQPDARTNKQREEKQKWLRKICDELLNLPPEVLPLEELKKTLKVWAQMPDSYGRLHGERSYEESELEVINAAKERHEKFGGRRVVPAGHGPDD